MAAALKGYQRLTNCSYVIDKNGGGYIETVFLLTMSPIRAKNYYSRDCNILSGSNATASKARPIGRKGAESSSPRNGGSKGTRVAIADEEPSAESTEEDWAADEANTHEMVYSLLAPSDTAITPNRRAREEESITAQWRN